MSHRLAVVASHPIQYQSPWFRELSSHPEIDLEVMFCHQATAKEQADAGFGVEFDWDLSLLNGYPHRFLSNVAAQPSVHGFKGLDTPEVAEIIAREKYDAVIVNGWHYKSAWQTMRACWKTGTPVMVRSDSHLHTQRSFAKQTAKWPFYRWFIPKLDGCLAVGKWSRDYFLHYGARPEQIFTVPHVIDDNFFSHESKRYLPQRSEIREAWGIDQNSVVFLFAGKFVEKKRPMDFARAIQGAAKSESKVAGLMVGDGPLRAQCEEFAKANDLPIKFAGFLNQSEIVKAYVASDALVLPSDGGETWGLVVNEAMACGLPCFVSDRVGCGPDMVVQNETGAIFPLGDIDRLTSLLSDFAREISRRESMSKLALKKAASYSTGAAVAATVEALRGLRANSK